MDNIDNEKIYSVYIHTSPNNKVYIGITSMSPPEKRWKNGLGYCQNKHFYSAIQKYGWKNFKHEILFSGLTKKEADDKEMELIALYNATNREKGYNKNNGGSSVGRLTEEQKKNLSRIWKEKFKKPKICLCMGNIILKKLSEKCEKQELGLIFPKKQKEK